MDMSFHRNPNLFRSLSGQAGRLPASGLPQRGRIVDGEVALRALSHIELMALVSNRINQGRVRHWVSEKQVERLSAHPRDARIALFAGPAARRPVWATGALGAFSPALDLMVKADHAESGLDNKNECPVYLGGSNNRKETGVKPQYRGTFPQGESPAAPMDTSTTFSI